MVSIDIFLELVSRFAEVNGISEATVSTRLFNDGKRLKLLREGGDLGVRKLDDAVQFMSDHWPEGKSWPRNIRRPDQVRSKKVLAPHRG
jgi:hypothetical protein